MNQSPPSETMPIAAEPRLSGKPISRILCKSTGALVGYLYRWNNGDLQPAWLNDASVEVRYEPMVDAA